MDQQPKSRLDRELDEILQKKSREPIAFKTHPRVQQQRQQTSSNPATYQVLQAWQWLKGMPIVLAYVFVFLAMLVQEVSPLLALLLCSAAVVSLWLPGIRGLVRPAQATGADVKYWRGRPYVTEIKSAVSRSPIDSIKRYFDRRR